MTKKIGIWIDKRVSKIVLLKDESEELLSVESNIEEFRPKGGSGTRLKGGPQDVVQDSKFLEREKHQLKDYFGQILDHIKDAESIIIFGPAQTGEKLFKEISESRADLGEKVRGVAKADSMTDNQVRAWVREYFAES